MDFKDLIIQFANRVETICPQIKTEEATKNALIMPFIQLLGYDVFNPFEVNPEYIADLGIKKGEKVDYAILIDGKPCILIECKHYEEKLDPHNSQLFRYFHVSEAKFALLTNGVQFRFYTDLNTPNKMDEKPFFEFDITKIRDNEIAELKKFHKSNFDIDKVTNVASELKFLNEVKTLINREIASPSDELTKYFAKQIHNSAITAKILEQFQPLVKKAFSLILNESISGSLKQALQSEQQNEPTLTETTDKSLINTTEEEVEAFMIIKAILRKDVPIERITMRDAQSYCAILLDDNNRKPIARLYLEGKKWSIQIAADNKEFIRFDILSLDEIYNYSDQLSHAVSLYN